MGMTMSVVIESKDMNWQITAIGTEFLDWMRRLFASEEETAWVLRYYSGSMTIVTVTNKEIMTPILLRWAHANS